MITMFATSFALGLATSVHCIAMCGPMVVTYVVRCADDATWWGRLAPNLAYQGARITSYVVVGTLLGAIGSVLDFDAARPWVMVIAGVFMIVLGLGMTGRFPWALKLTPRPPKALITAVSRLRRKATAAGEESEGTLVVPIAFGLLTGLMPCAPLQAAELVAATSGSALYGGVVMLAFGLGTAPLLLIFGTASSMVPTAWKQRLHSALAIVVIISGLIFLNRAALLTGFPISSRAVTGLFSGSTSQSALEFTEGADGVAEVPLVIQNVQYFPSSVVVPANRPVRLIVDRREAVGCSDFLVIADMGVSVPLAPNATTEVELPASEPGTYPMTCGMGMMSGEIVVRTP